MFILTCVSMFIQMSLSVCVCVCVCVRLYVYVCANVCIYIYVCFYISILILFLLISTANNLSLHFRYTTLSMCIGYWDTPTAYNAEG